MPYLQDAASLIIEVLLGLFLIATILRFLFQLFRVDFRNPIAQTIVTVTNPPLKILRRFVPGLYGIDLASVVLILIVAVIKLLLLIAAAGASQPGIGAILLMALAEVLNLTCWILLIAIFVRAIISWVAPQSQHPAIRILDGLSEPILAPFRRLLPSMGGLDLSPIFAILAINLVQRLVVAPMFDYARIIG